MCLTLVSKTEKKKTLQNKIISLIRLEIVKTAVSFAVKTVVFI